VILAAGLSPAWQQIVVLDQFWPGEVNRAREVHWCGSGKVLNVGLALHHLGTECRLLSLLGGMAYDAIEQEFAGLDIPRRWIKTAAPTRVCTTVLDAGGTATELVENARAVTADEIDAFRNAYRQEAAHAGVVVLTGSLPAGVPPTLHRELLAETPGRAILDFRGPELHAALELRPFLVKPNREELAATTGKPVSTEEELWKAMEDLIARGAQWVVITEGRRAVSIASAAGRWRIQPPTVTAVNPIGCGDCLAAGTAAALAAGADVPQAVRHGVAAAAENAAALLPARLDPRSVLALAETIEIEML
jgi:1-phosphofructokinase family hexose kinase